jgi:peptide/nickel transport system substrate-binding protein
MRFSLRLCYVLLALALGLPALAQKTGGTLIALVQPEPPTLASYLSTSGPIGQVSPKIYEGLLEYDFNLDPKPGLASSWEVSEDGKTVTFHLQEGVTWHDGEPFTSADVKFTVEEVLSQVHPRGPNTFRELASIDTPDEHTVVFNLANPAPYMMRALSGYESPMVPKHLLEGTDIRDNDLANDPVGTGPFKFVEWAKGQYIRLDKNEDYWRDGLPYLDRVVLRFIPDAATRTAAMERGEVHMAAFGALPNVDVVRVREQEGIGVTTDGYSMINPMALLELDTTQPPLDNKLVRQAIAHAIDQQFIIDNIWFGYGKPATGAVSSNFASTGLYNPDLPRYDGGPEVANQLLDEAGFPRNENGVRFSIMHDIIPYGEEWQRLGEYLKQALGDVGIELELRYEDVPTWLKRVYGDYDFTLNSNFFYQLADPSIGVDRQYHSSQIRQGTVFVNSSRYSNPEVDELLNKAAMESDPQVRAELYHRFQEIVAEDLPVIPLFEMEFVVVYDERFKDLIASPLGAYGNFAEAWLDE